MVDSFKTVIVVSDVEFWAATGKIDKLQISLDNGGDARAADPDGYSALHAACENGHFACAKLLIARGADVRASTHDGLLPIDLADMEGHDAIVELLRQHGGD